MPARQSPSIPLMFGVGTIFLGGLAFGAVAALSQPEPRANPNPKPKPVEVAKAEPTTPASKPVPKAEPTPATKPEPKPEVKPEPKKTEPTKTEVKKPEPKKPEPEPKKPEPAKPEPPKVAAVTFQQVQRVLRANCVVCHGDPLIKAKIDLRTLDSIKKKKGLVEPGDPAASDLWGTIEAGTMPPPDAKTKLTEGEKRIIKDWIAGGAK